MYKSSNLCHNYDSTINKYDGDIGAATVDLETNDEEKYWKSARMFSLKLHCFDSYFCIVA